jgi:outer membrane protein
VRRRIAVLATISLFSGSPAAAQTTLTLESALAEGHAANRTLKQSAAGAERAAAQASISRAALLPRVIFSEAWQRGDAPVLAFTGLLGARQFASGDFAIDRLNRPGPVSVYSGRLMVSQLLFDGGHARAAAAAAARHHEVASADHEIAGSAIALDIVRAYGRVLAADAAGRAAAAAVAAGEEDLRRAEARRSSGAATDADVLLVSTHLSAVRRQAIAAAGHASVARASLNRLTGAPVAREFAVAEPAMARLPQASLNDLFAEGEATRQEIRRAIAVEAAAAQQVKAARALWLPTVTMRAGYEGTGLRLSDRAGSWIAAAEMGWSLSTGGADRARVRAASADVLAARAARDDATASVHVEIVAAIKGLESALAQLVLADQAITSAREAHRILRNRYDNGMATAADVLSAAAAVLEAENSRARAGVDAMVATADLQRALGRPITGRSE